MDYAVTNRISHGIWGGLTERERRTLRTSYLQAVRSERDRDVSAAAAGGHTAAAFGRSFGLSRTSVTRIVRGGSDAGRRDEPRRRDLETGS